MAKEQNDYNLNNDYIIIEKDPLDREIRLKSTTWHFHITGGDNYRKEFIGQEKIIKDVITDPAYILPNDPDNPNDTREKYIDLVQLPTLKSLKALVVVVDHEKAEYGDIVTIMAKNRLNSETGGALYVRPKFTGSK